MWRYIFPPFLETFQYSHHPVKPGKGIFWQNCGIFATETRSPLRFRNGNHVLFRCQHHQHLATFHAGILFHLGFFGGIFLHALQQLHAQLAMGKFTTAETQRDLDLVTFADELQNCPHLHIIIMIVDVGTHLDLFDLLRLLGFAGEVGLFLGLILRA